MAPAPTALGARAAAPPQQPSTWASWLGWGGKPAQQPAASAVAGAEAGGELSANEWRQLEELLTEQVLWQEGRGEMILCEHGLVYDACP